MPRVSVIIATYNWSSVLRHAIASVLRQTMTDFELLVVGDGCTDDSADVVAATGDPRVQWINLPENSGHQSAPNNEGLRRARGELIAYLGHDDLWLPHHLDASLHGLARGDADISCALVARVGPESAYVWPSLTDVNRGLFPPPAGIVHRRTVTERLGGWRDYRTIEAAPDADLWRRAAAASIPFTLVPRLTAIKFPASWRKGVYRVRPSHEQAAWLARIEQEPDLEARELAGMVAADRPSGASYGELLRFLARETTRRIAGRLTGPSAIVRGPGRKITAARHYKGL